jgi:predicted RecA/RadA family phage recombinase
MKNYIQEGETMNYTAGAAITAGQMVLVTGVVGIAVSDCASGAVGVMATMGVFEVAKEGTDAPAQGQIMYYNATNGTATVTASSNKVIGYAWAAAASGDSTVQVRLSI